MKQEDCNGMRKEKEMDFDKLLEDGVLTMKMLIGLDDKFKDLCEPSFEAFILTMMDTYREYNSDFDMTESLERMKDTVRLARGVEGEKE